MFAKGLSHLVAKLSKRDVIVQFSPPRSGSTLVYNILREVFPAKAVQKVHTYDEKYAASRVVVTYRHPLDSIASVLQCYGRAPTDEAIRETVLDLERNGIWDVLRIRDYPNVLMLQYERFRGDFNYIYDALERAYGIVLPPPQRARLSSRYQIEAVEKLAAQHGSFAEYDPVTQVHGKHISRYRGQSYYYAEVLSGEQVAHLERIYAAYLKAFDYPCGTQPQPAVREAKTR